MSLDPVTAVLDIGGKLCKRCNETKPPSEFRFRNDTKKLRAECKVCASKSENSRYYRRKSDILKRDKAWREDNPVAKLLKSAKSSAMIKNLEFNITADDIHIPEVCPYLGVVLTNTLGQGVVWSNASIDRIDSNKGYVKGNIQIISRKANAMKQDASAEELTTFAKNVLRILEEDTCP